MDRAQAGPTLRARRADVLDRPGRAGRAVAAALAGATDEWLREVATEAIGPEAHDAATVTLFLEESFTFRVLGDDAAVALLT